jgi:hypothetical protein
MKWLLLELYFTNRKKYFIDIIDLPERPTKEDVIKAFEDIYGMFGLHVEVDILNIRNIEVRIWDSTPIFLHPMG